MRSVNHEKLSTRTSILIAKSENRAVAVRQVSNVIASISKKPFCHKYAVRFVIDPSNLDVGLQKIGRVN